MTKLNNIICSALISVLFSCCAQIDNKQMIIENKKIQLTSLAGQVYIYAPEIDTTTCKATGACDCCSGNIYFLNDSIFIKVDICESNIAYSKGVYRIKKDFVELSIDSLNIEIEYNWEKETDTTGKVMAEYLIKQSKTPTFTVKLTLLDCKNYICFITGDHQKLYVTPDKDLNVSEFIGQLKKDSIWHKLEIN